jgi:hypothetical protein
MSPIDIASPRFVDEFANPVLAPLEARKSAEDRLRHSEYLELRNISCDVHDGVLTLRGRVPSYHLKQLAQTLLAELAGILRLNNQLEVVSSRDARPSNGRPNHFSTRPRRYI